MYDAAAAASLFSDSYEEDDVSEFSRTESDANKKVIQITKDYLVKLSLSESADHDKREQYRAHVQSMLLLGDGETIIELGVGIDDTADRGLSKRDLDLSERNHKALLKRFDAISTRIVINQRGNLYTNVQLVRVEKGPDDFIEVRIAVIGNVDAGKSTLLGVLTHDALDDGRGHARQKLFRHKHEFESGRTSSVSNDILGFDSKGNVVNKPDVHTGRLDWATICRDSTKVITFIDLAGHEKYLKTTIFGITGHAPDYAMLMVGGNAGITGMTKEHLSLALSLNIPVFVVVTKIDMCPEQVLSETMKNLEKLMKSPGVRKISFAVRTLEDVARAAIHFSDGKVCPIFQLSNVVGTNLNLLRTFLNLIPFHRKFNIDCPAEFQVDDVFWVDGVGTVVSGTCLAGIISINDVMMLGPNQIGGFISVPIKSIQRKRLPVSMIHAGQTASFSIRKVNKKEVRKGMVLLSPDIEICSSIQFEAEILILHHSTTIIKNYQAMVHIGSVRQTATIIDMRKPLLRSGDRDLVTLKFIRYPEYIRVGSRVVFREGRSKAVGTVTRVYPYIHPMCAAKQSQPKGTKHPGGWKGKKSGDSGSRKGGSVDRKESSVSITANGDTKDLCSAKSTDRK